MKKALFNRDFILLCLARAASSTIFSLLTTTMIFYTTVALGIDSGLSGIVTGVFVLASLPSRIWVGVYTQMIGERNLLVVSALVFFICTLCYLFLFDVSLLIVLRGIHGAAFGVISNALSTAVVKEVPQENLGEGMGYFSLGSTLAYAIGPFAGISFSQAANFTEMYIFCAVCALLLVGCAALLKDPSLRGARRRRLENHDDVGIGSFFGLSLRSISVVSGILNMCYVSVSAFMNTYAVSYSLDAVAPWFFVIYSGGVLLSRPIMGKLFDKKGPQVAVSPLFLVCAFAFFVLAELPSVFGLLCAALLFAFGYGSLFTNLQTQMVSGVSVERMGVCTAMFFVCADIGLGMGSVVWGYALEYIDFSAMYIIAGVILLMIFMLYQSITHCSVSSLKSV